MTSTEFNASLKYCENEAELRFHHASQLFASLGLLADQASRGEIESAALIEAIRNAKYRFANTKRTDLRDREAEIAAHGEPSTQWLG